MLAYEKGKPGPPKFSALCTLNPMNQQIENTSFPPYGRHPELPSLAALVDDPGIATSRADNLTSGHLCGKHHVSPMVMSGTIFNSLETKSVIQYGRGHGRNLLLLFDCSQTTCLLPCPSSSYFYRYSSPG